MRQFRQLQVSKQGDVYVVRFLQPRLSDSLAVEVGEELYWVAQQPDCTRLLLNFSGVEHLSSAVLGKLLSLNRKMKQKGKLKACEISPGLRSAFMWTVLETADTEPNALKAF